MENGEAVQPWRIVRFHEVGMDHIYRRCWIVRVRVLKKGHLSENVFGNLQIRLILAGELNLYMSMACADVIGVVVHVGDIEFR
ncbi:hypothetical protein E2562_011738 [Oryza meyeriana var. granulata]|uniref:Uncharacterized protein n=1 Tax=Oryza meyeriana var. granulata TaxID=110450 RepID=A0A6G1DHR1_9ORYZ|nr:hypothetical protein E2562_011738 [Oryza meyeriana var. granulata]